MATLMRIRGESDANYALRVAFFERQLAKRERFLLAQRPTRSKEARLSGVHNW